MVNLFDFSELFKNFVSRAITNSSDCWMGHLSLSRYCIEFLFDLTKAPYDLNLKGFAYFFFNDGGHKENTETRLAERLHQCTVVVLPSNRWENTVVV